MFHRTALNHVFIPRSPLINQAALIAAVLRMGLATTRCLMSSGSYYCFHVLHSINLRSLSRENWFPFVLKLIWKRSRLFVVNPSVSLMNNRPIYVTVRAVNSPITALSVARGRYERLTRPALRSCGSAVTHSLVITQESFIGTQPWRTTAQPRACGSRGLQWQPPRSTRRDRILQHVVSQ